MMGRRMGVSIRIAGVVSMTIPTNSRKILTTIRISTLFPAKLSSIHVLMV